MPSKRCERGAGRAYASHGSTTWSRGDGAPSRGWSPEQVAGRLAGEHGRKVISYETIYSFIYAQIRRTGEFSWRHHLPRGKSKRGLRPKTGGRPSKLHRRPCFAGKSADRGRRSQHPGPLGSRPDDVLQIRPAVPTVHERTSRLLLRIRLASKVTRGVARHVVAVRRLATRPAAERHRVRRFDMRAASI